MKKSDFIKKRKDFEKSFKRNDWIYAAIFMLLLLANWFVVAKLNVLDDVPEYVSWIYLALFFAFLFGNMFLIKIFQNSQIRKSGLNCQHCKEPLIGQQADIAVSTDNCPMCGNHAFN